MSREGPFSTKSPLANMELGCFYISHETDHPVHTLQAGKVANDLFFGSETFCSYILKIPPLDGKFDVDCILA